MGFYIWREREKHSSFDAMISFQILHASRNKHKRVEGLVIVSIAVFPDMKRG